MDIIISTGQKVIQRAVSLIVPPRLYLNGNDCPRREVIDEKIHFALGAVVVVEQLIAVRTQFLCHDRLIDGSKIDASLVLHDGLCVQTIQLGRKHSHIVQIELEQVLV